MSGVKLPVYIPSQAKSEDNIFLFHFVLSTLPSIHYPLYQMFFSCVQPDASLMWPKTVFHTNKHGGKKSNVRRRRFLKIYSLKFCDIWQNFYFCHILNNENFKMEVEQTNFVTQSIITVQLYYYLKICLLKFSQINFKCE